jgi:hypothetical protein
MVGAGRAASRVRWLVRQEVSQVEKRKIPFSLIRYLAFPAMSCVSCSRRTLGLFIRSLTDTHLLRASSTPARHEQLSRFSSVAPPAQQHQELLSTSPKPPTRHVSAGTRHVGTKKPEPWQIQKAALKEKLGGLAWSPRKKLSPDTMEGIRHLHQTRPRDFTTEVLANHFKVSPEAIRRILKSKWRPSDEEHEDKLRRWDKRGERIWSNLVELGVKPPKRWREMGVGRASPGQRPKWKDRRRNLVPVNDNFESSDDIIPIVDGRTGERYSREQRVSLVERML